VWFRNVARGKRSLKLNLKDDGGRELFYALAKTADVVVEAFRPGVVKRLGVDYDSLKAINPALIYCSISAFGQTGSLVQKPAHDITVQAHAGLVDLNRGLDDDKPAMPNIPFADASASLLALSAVCIALYRREKTGEGDYIDLSMFDAALAWTPNVQGPTFGEDRSPEPKTMRSFGGAAMYNIYETADAHYVILGGSELKFASNLLTALGREDLLSFARKPPGPEQEPLKAFFRGTFRTQLLQYWRDFLSDVDCCWSWNRTLKDVRDDPFTQERGMVFQDAEGNWHLGPAIKFQEEPAQPRTNVPAFGEHSAELAAEVGLDDQTISDLTDREVI
ncbi:MAG: CoA transferase, partial [Parvularculaceae bacterium]|nr:CoA transferase [Parvularculaceae bacterium]